MKNLIFRKNTISEFDFLKKSNNMLTSGTAIKIDALGSLIPLNSSLIENKNLVKKIMDWDIKSHENDSNLFLDELKNTISSTEKICFLVADKSFNFCGLIQLSANFDSRCDLLIDNLIYDSLHQNLIFKAINTLIKWSISVLFFEQFFIKLSFKNEVLLDKLSKINFTQTEDNNNLLKLSKDRSIGESLILTAGPSIGSREKVFSLDAASNGWNNQWSKYLKEFESKFAEYVGVKYAIATSSCTGAMHIALMSLDLKKGDEVIVPDITWVSTANAVLLAGGIPVFADIDLKTWKIDPNSIKKLINKNTRAIMPVHLYGNPCDMDIIMEIAKENNLFVIEDAAPSIGAEINGKKTGSFGHFSAFSFQGAKLAVTGEGGMLCTNDDELYKKAYRIHDQGRIPGTFWIEELGLKYKMSNIQAALGLGQIIRNDAMVEAKRRINNWYRDRLEGIECIDFWSEDENSKSIYWMTNIRLNEKSKINRDKFCEKLKSYNIDSRPVFPAISQYPYWPKKQDPQPIAKLVGDTGINLPSGVALTKDHINYICDKIIKILKH
jgi:perosamine synthetase